MAAMVFAFVPSVGGPSLNGMLAGSGLVPNFYVLNKVLKKNVLGTMGRLR